MDRIREFYDSGSASERIDPTPFQTDRNRNELYCRICGESFFVDDRLFDDVMRMTEEMLDNPFVCQGCGDIYEDAADGY